MERTEESLKIELQGNSVFFFFFNFSPNAIESNTCRLWLDICCPTSLFAWLWTETESRSINTQKMNEAKMQPSGPEFIIWTANINFLQATPSCPLG